MPSTPVIGVRTSCPRVARKRVLASDASRATSFSCRARCRASRRESRSRYSSNAHHSSSTINAANPASAGDVRHHGGCTVNASDRSEEHTSELQSRENLVCRLLLEKKNKIQIHRQL